MNEELIPTITYADMVRSSLPEFEEKHKKYGPTLTVLRLYSILEQIFIKVSRIRTIQEKKAQLVQDSIEDEFSGIFNYSIFLKIKIRCLKNNLDLDMLYKKDPVALYKGALTELENLYAKKNHDYGEVWREMRVSSMVDLMLVKTLRFAQISDDESREEKDKLNDYDEIASDIANYAVFCKVRIAEGYNPMK